MNENKGRSLTGEYPLLVLPSLAKAIGLNEAIILQQIHYWVTINAEKNINLNEGFFWTYNSVRRWKEQFPFLSEITIKRKIKKLEEMGILISDRFNEMSRDRTKWYRIDYEALEPYLSPLDQNDTMEDIKLILCHWIKMTQPLPKTSVPNISNKEVQGSPPESNIANHTKPISFKDVKRQCNIAEMEGIVIEYFLHQYKKHRGERHPPLRRQTWERILEKLFLAEDIHGQKWDLTPDEMYRVIDRYFETKFAGNCNYQLGHFVSPKQKGYRHYELQSHRKEEQSYEDKWDFERFLDK